MHILVRMSPLNPTYVNCLLNHPHLTYSKPDSPCSLQSLLLLQPPPLQLPGPKTWCYPCLCCFSHQQNASRVWSLFTHSQLPRGLRLCPPHGPPGSHVCCPPSALIPADRTSFFSGCQLMSLLCSQCPEAFLLLRIKAYVFTWPPGCSASWPQRLLSPWLLPAHRLLLLLAGLPLVPRVCQQHSQPATFYLLFFLPEYPSQPGLHSNWSLGSFRSLLKGDFLMASLVTQFKIATHSCHLTAFYLLACFHFLYNIYHHSICCFLYIFYLSSPLECRPIRADSFVCFYYYCFFTKVWNRAWHTVGIQ